MTFFAKIHFINHGLDKTDISKVYWYENGKFEPIPSDQACKRNYGDWTVITDVIDADNFECFTGEEYILNLSTNLSVNKMTEQEQRDINSFTWNAQCTEDQIKRMQHLREAGKLLCEQIIHSVPNCADRSAGIRSLRLAVMQCNLAIAHESYNEKN
jgi:hypothetical protein